MRSDDIKCGFMSLDDWDKTHLLLDLLYKLKLSQYDISLDMPYMNRDTVPVWWITLVGSGDD